MERITFFWNGAEVQCPPGMTLAGALFLASPGSTVPVARHTARLKRPRSLLCGMGVCHDCVVEVNGRSNVRSCMTRAEPGMRVEPQCGDARLRIDPAS